MEQCGIRWDGSQIEVVKLGTCEVRGCRNDAYKENCNAEGSETRMHWHGLIHTVADDGNGRGGLKALCQCHAEEARQAWRKRRTKTA